MLVVQEDWDEESLIRNNRIQNAVLNTLNQTLHAPAYQSVLQRYGISGAVISAVDLIHGLGRYAGMDSIEVEGVTGLYDTNYEGKARGALEALKTHDLVYVHIEGPDEAAVGAALRQAVLDLDADARIAHRKDRVPGIMRTFSTHPMLRLVFEPPP